MALETIDLTCSTKHPVLSAQEVRSAPTIARSNGRCAFNALAESMHRSERPSVCYIATHYPAVSHTFITDEIEAVERHGIDVHVISINTIDHVSVHNDRLDRRASTFYVKGVSKARAVTQFLRTAVAHPTVLAIPVQRGDWDLRGLLWRYFQLAEAVLVFREMRRTGTRHVHAHFGQVPATVAWFAVEIAHRHRSCSDFSWSMTVHGWHEFVDEHESMLRQKVAAARFVACISDFTRAQLLRIAAPEDWHKLSVVRCGIDFERFVARSPRDPGPQPRIVMVARISPEKGQIVLLDAVRALVDSGLDIQVDLIGPGQAGFAEVVEQHASDAGLTDRVVFHGSLDSAKVAELLGQSDVFCLPTFAEGLPIVIMEAMARSLPVVTTYISGIPELARHHDTAWVVPAARPDLLADAIREVLTDHVARRATVDRALVEVRAKHDIGNNATRLVELFLDATGATA